MKKILLAFFVSLFLGFGAKAQITVNNNLSCDVEVWRVCTLNGVNVTETLFDVAAMDNVNVPECDPPYTTEFFVRKSDVSVPCTDNFLQVTPFNTAPPNIMSCGCISGTSILDYTNPLVLDINP